MGAPPIVIVAAVDRALAIGRDNDLPWRLPADLAHFKRLTLGKPVLMGRRTAESLGRALPKRRNLVLTRSGRAPFAGMEAVASLAEATALAEADGELCVIGGAEVYALALPHASVLHLTRVDTVVADADTFFPSFHEDGWRVASRTPHPADARHAFAFEFVEYRRP
jgi:dihydrofolate reductase